VVLLSGASRGALQLCQCRRVHTTTITNTTVWYIDIKSMFGLPCTEF
jgi:hypothetical protein